MFPILSEIIRGKPLMVLILKFEVKMFLWLLKIIIIMGLNENWRMG